jgi:hypothetical protein
MNNYQDRTAPEASVTTSRYRRTRCVELVMFDRTVLRKLVQRGLTNVLDLPSLPEFDASCEIEMCRIWQTSGRCTIAKLV